MPGYDGQRKHIIHSLESVLYQLHTLSFLLSPSIWVYIARITSQAQFAHPASHSLRWYFALVLFFQSPAVFIHAKEGAAQGRSVILDFVGLAAAPSKLHLLLLDFLIIVLELLLTVIAYETIYAAASARDTPDPLLPLSPMPLQLVASTSHDALKYTEPVPPDPPYILDLRFSLVAEHFRNPPTPPPRDRSLDQLLPLPNTTALPVSASLRLLLNARQRFMNQARAAETAQGRRQREDGTAPSERGTEASDERQAVPGGLDGDEET